MIFRSLFVLTLLVTLFTHTLNAINPAHLRQRHHEELGSLIDTNSNDIDDERLAIVIKRNNGEAEEEDDDDDDDNYSKRNKYTNFHLSPLWLSRRTRTNRFYGKPLWVSRPGR
jgi:hypothetical protein